MIPFAGCWIWQCLAGIVVAPARAAERSQRDATTTLCPTIFDATTMKSTKSIFLFITWLLVVARASAQLAVTVEPPKVVGQKAIVQIAMTNNLADAVQSARAICFLLDKEGKMIGQSTKWVIGGAKDRPALMPEMATTFDFVMTNPQAITTTNLVAKVSFNRVVLAGGRPAIPDKTVIIQAAEKSNK